MTEDARAEIQQHYANLRHLRRQPHVVYEFYDDAGEAVYIGCTVNIVNRLRDHQSGPFWHEVAEIHTTRYPNHAIARVEEELLIRQHEPRWNLTYTDQASENARARHQRRREALGA